MKVIRGHLGCPLSGGCPFFGGYAIGGSTVIIYKILINLKINKVEGRMISMPSLENQEWGLTYFCGALTTQITVVPYGTIVIYSKSKR